MATKTLKKPTAAHKNQHLREVEQAWLGRHTDGGRDRLREVVDALEAKGEDPKRVFRAIAGITADELADELSGKPKSKMQVKAPKKATK